MRILPSIVLFSVLFSCKNENKTEFWDGAGNSNPLVPGYFADPTIKKFGDTYYIYATTDGVKLASGEPTVWVSQNLTDWYNQELDIDLPQGLTNCWAPDVIKGTDGNFYYFMGNCQFGCNIYAYVSDNPIGLWKPYNNGEPVIPVGTGSENLPALDAQFLQTSKGELFSYFGTWCHIFKGLGWAQHNPDTVSKIAASGYIPIEQIPQMFEAAYPIERNGKIILMYSSGDCRKSSYAVHYAWAGNPTGPFTYGKNNPILESNADFTVDGPGHHSLIEADGQWYILYHRHDNPHSSGGEFRQLVADQLVFSNDTTIEKIIPTHRGINHFGLKSDKPKNLAFKAPVEASSVYRLKAEKSPYTKTDTDHSFLASYAVDDNNGTLWKAASANMPQTLTIDLGKNRAIKRIFTEFEYTTYYYQYTLEVSSDGDNWQLFANRSDNRTSGSPMIDDNDLTGRFVRLTIVGTEKTGMFAAVWNLKVYSQLFDVPGICNKPATTQRAMAPTQKLEIAFDAKQAPFGKLAQEIDNPGATGGTFLPFGNCYVTEKKGVKALQLDGNSFLELSKPAPESFNWNAPFTASAWIYVTEPGEGQCLLLWNSRNNMLQASYAALMFGKGHYGAMAHGDGSVDLRFKNLPSAAMWHQVTVTFDGMVETIYVDGQKDHDFPLNLFVEAGTVRIGSSGIPPENFTGWIANVQLFNKAFTADEVLKHVEETRP